MALKKVKSNLLSYISQFSQLKIKITEYLGEMESSTYRNEDDLTPAYNIYEYLDISVEEFKHNYNNIVINIKKDLPIIVNELKIAKFKEQSSVVEYLMVLGAFLYDLQELSALTDLYAMVEYTQENINQLEYFSNILTV